MKPGKSMCDPVDKVSFEHIDHRLGLKHRFMCLRSKRSNGHPLYWPPAIPWQIRNDCKEIFLKPALPPITVRACIRKEVDDEAG